MSATKSTIITFTGTHTLPGGGYRPTVLLLDMRCSRPEERFATKREAARRAAEIFTGFADQMEQMLTRQGLVPIYHTDDGE
jgi:hypothetical protein